MLSHSVYNCPSAGSRGLETVLCAYVEYCLKYQLNLHLIACLQSAVNIYILLYT